jgi:hypothetical protein
MQIHRFHRKHAHHDGTVPAPASGKTKTRTSFFDGIDAAARSFLGPADRTDGHRPVVHLHDDAENSTEEMLSSIEVYTDSAGHHYAQRKAPLQRPESG